MILDSFGDSALRWFNFLKIYLSFLFFLMRKVTNFSPLLPASKLEHLAPRGELRDCAGSRPLCPRLRSSEELDRWGGEAPRESARRALSLPRSSFPSRSGPAAQLPSRCPGPPRVAPTGPHARRVWAALGPHARPSVLPPPIRTPGPRRPSARRAYLMVRSLDKFWTPWGVYTVSLPSQAEHLSRKTMERSPSAWLSRPLPCRRPWGHTCPHAGAGAPVRAHAARAPAVHS